MKRFCLFGRHDFVERWSFAAIPGAETQTIIGPAPHEQRIGYLELRTCARCGYTPSGKGSEARDGR